MPNLRVRYAVMEDYNLKSEWLSSEAQARELWSTYVNAHAKGSTLVYLGVSDFITVERDGVEHMIFIKCKVEEV